MGLWLKADGQREECAPANGVEFTVEELHALVGGWIEVLRLGRTGRWLIVNEEGRLRNLPVNNVASMVYAAVGGRDVIVGDAVIAEPHEIS